MMLRKYLLESMTQYELAHKTAQKNAALPIEQGGLGLHPNNTAQERANAMGYTTKAYHGTKNNVEIKSFVAGGISNSITNGDAYGIGTYFTDNPLGAKSYSGEQGHIIPVLLKTNNVVDLDNPSDDHLNKIKKVITPHPTNAMIKHKHFNEDEIEEAKKFFTHHKKQHELYGQGYDRTRPQIEKTEKGFNITYRDFNEMDIKKDELRDVLKHEHYNVNQAGLDGIKFKHGILDADWHIINKPHLIRSIHAAFDPMRKHESDLLA